MSDLLDDLRRANPVDATKLHLPAELDERARERARPRPHRLHRAGAAGVVLAACAIALAIGLAGRSGGPDLAARAYAASTGTGVIHWRTEITSYTNGRRLRPQRMEGWKQGAVTHILFYEGTRLTFDFRVSGRRERSWMASTNDYVTTKVPAHRSFSPFSFGEDPFEAFRHAYRTGNLRPAGPGRFRVFLGKHVDSSLNTMTYELDPKTARPLRLVFRAQTPAAAGRTARRNVMISRFAVYEKLPATPANRAKLALLPHPGAGPSKIPAATYFAALRGGAPVTGASGGRVRGLASHMRDLHIDPDGIRELRPGVWLLPGRGYVCLAVKAPPISNRRQESLSVGAGCSTIAQAVKRGAEVGTRRGITIAVPDGVTAVRAKQPGHPWRTFPIRRGIVDLPSLGYHWRLVR